MKQVYSCFPVFAMLVILKVLKSCLLIVFSLFIIVIFLSKSKLKPKVKLSSVRKGAFFAFDAK